MENQPSFVVDQCKVVEHNHHDHATMVDGQKDQRMGEVAEPVSDRDHRGEMPLDDGGTVPEEHRLLDANDGMLHEVGTIVEVPHEEHQEDEEHQPEQQHQSSSMAIDRGVDVNMLHQAVEQRVTDVVVNRQHVPLVPSEAQMKSMPVAEHFQPTTATVSNANLSTVPAIRRTTTILVVEDCIPTNGIDHQHSYQHPPVRYGRRQSNDHEEARTRMARTMLPVKLVPESKKTFPLMDPALDHLYLVEPGSAGSVPTTVGALGETNLTRHGCSVVRPGPGDETLAPCGDWPQFKMKMMDGSKMLVVDHHQLVDGSNSIILSPIGSAGTPTLASSPGATSLLTGTTTQQHQQQHQLQTLHQHMVNNSQQQQQQQQQQHTIQQQSPTPLPMTTATLVQQIAAQNHHQQQQQQQQQLHVNAAGTTTGISFLAHHHHPQQQPTAVQTIATGATTVLSPQQQQQQQQPAPQQQQQQPGMSIFQLQPSPQPQQPHGSGTQTVLGGVATSHPMTVAGNSAIQLTSEASPVIKPFVI